MKINIKKIILNIFLLFLITLIFITSFIYVRIRISLPKRKGTIKLEGIKDKVFIYFNEYGIPYIEAKYLDDVIFAQGYLHAQDRLFQMDLLRRIAYGELSEIFGEKTFKVDSFFRILGIKRISKKIIDSLFPIEKRILEDYAKGVNAYIKERKGMLPPEFLILNYKPDEWKIEHTIAIGKLISWNLNLSFKGDLLFTKIKNEKDSITLKKILPYYPEDAPFQIEKSPLFEEKVFKFLNYIEDLTPQFIASNSFAVSDPPLLENDPHLNLTIPSNWYLISISSDSLTITGFSIPGIPLIVPGTNWNIAVGVTSLQLDDGDFIKMDTLNMKIIEEKIKIKGKKERKIKIKLKDDIPLIDPKNSLFYFWRSKLISHEIYSIYKLYTSKNIYQADSALRYFRSPALNFVIVDKGGNLLYKGCGWIEKRTKPSIFPRTKIPDEFLPDSLLPKYINPKIGYIASNNNPPYENYKYYISLYFSPSGRARRLHELLRKEKEFNIEKFMKISTDIKDSYAELIIEKITRILKNIPMEKKEKEIFQKLSNFDFVMKKDKEEPLLFYKLIFKILKNNYGNMLGKENYKEFLSFNYIPLTVLENNIKNGNIDNYIIIKSFRELCEEYKREIYGKYHKVKFKHPLQAAPLIGNIFKIKEIGMDGSLTTINKMGFLLSKPYDVIEGPSMRMIIDLNNRNFYYVNPPGQCGIIFDRHFSDQLNKWAKGEFISLFPFSVYNKLTLTPISD